MHYVIRATDISKAPNRTRKFEGDGYGVGISFFAVDLDPGQGPGLHVHPYHETWLVLAGAAEFEIGEEALVAFPGDVVIVPPRTPHRFMNKGDQPLEMVCIHASGRVVQRYLEDGERRNVPSCVEDGLL